MTSLMSSGERYGNVTQVVFRCSLEGFQSITSFIFIFTHVTFDILAKKDAGIDSLKSVGVQSEDG